MSESETTTSNTMTYVVIFAVVGIFSLALLGLYINEQRENEYWEKKLEESRNNAIIWNENFLKITDCKEMILQLTQKRFFDNTFKEQAWNHYKELC